MISLEALRNPDFLIYGVTGASAESLAETLRRSSEVAELRKYIAIQVIDRAQVEDFIRDIVSRVEIGKRSSYDISLAALAIVYERLGGPFPTEFLERLASLQVAELPMSTRVARIARRVRTAHVPGSTAKVLRVAPIPCRATLQAGPLGSGSRRSFAESA